MPLLCFLVLLNTAAPYRYNHIYCTLEGRVRDTCLLFAYPYSLVSYNTYILVQFSSCPTLYDRMNHRTPGLPVHHQLPEFTQTHVHRVSDTIQPSHPLLPPIPPSIRVFSNESTLRMRWPNCWSFSFSISPSMNTQD